MNVKDASKLRWWAEICYKHLNILLFVSDQSQFGFKGHQFLTNDIWPQF